VARQRPDMADRRPELNSDPIGQPITKRCAERARDPDRPEVDATLGNHGADGDQNSPGWEYERDERERFSKGKGTDDRCRPHFVGPHEFNNVLGGAVNLIFERHSLQVTVSASLGSLPRDRPDFRDSMQTLK
jgi:hypothetical protein